MRFNVHLKVRSALTTSMEQELSFGIVCLHFLFLRVYSCSDTWLHTVLPPQNAVVCVGSLCQRSIANMKTVADSEGPKYKIKALSPYFVQGSSKTKNTKQRVRAIDN